MPNCLVYKFFEKGVALDFLRAFNNIFLKLFLFTEINDDKILHNFKGFVIVVLLYIIPSTGKTSKSLETFKVILCQWSGILNGKQGKI